MGVYFRSKLDDVELSIFSEMSALAKEQKAINLSQGFPGFEVDKKLIDLIYKYMLEGKNQYAPMQGVLELRVAISNLIFKKYNSHYNVDNEITITAGATQAIYTAISTFVSLNDEVIAFSPAYDCYEPAVRVNGGITKFIPLDYPNYSIDWKLVEKTISNKTKLIILNSPHNPTGSVLNKKDINALEKITSGTDIIILSDEVYEHIVFDSKQHVSLCSSEKLKNRSLIVSSFGKSLHATGLKMGYIYSPEYLMKEFRKIHQYNVFSCNTSVQFAIADYISNTDYFDTLPTFFQKKRDLFQNAIEKSRFETLSCNGTYFQLLNYSKISYENDVNFAKRLTKEFKIAAIPISVFYPNKEDHKVLRFCFAKGDEEIERAAEILSKI